MIPPHHGDGDPRTSWRVLTSPLGDLLRGRITGPRPPYALRGWRGVVAHSDLPAALRETIATVCWSLRLWKEEKADVARELAAHFADGLAAGTGEPALIASFGDPRQAAALITRAKKRTRPIWWRALRRTRQAVAALVVLALVVYAYLAAQFFLRSPHIARNYMAELNAPILALPEADRAWPLYLQAILDQENAPKSLWNGWGEYRPGDPEWPDVTAYLGRNQPVLEAIHTASLRPVMGITYSNQPDPRLQAKALARHGRQEAPAAAAPDPNPMMFEVLLPHLGEMRNLARLLRMDAVAAAEAHDGARFVRDVETLVGLARQLEDGFFITQMVGLAVGRVACGAVDEALRDTPGALSDEHLVRAAHLIAGIGDSALRFDVERTFLDDLLQRIYSDEGSGHGRLTAEGLGVLTRVSDARAGQKGPDAVDIAMGPLQSAVIADRKEMTREYERVLGQMRAAREGPMWEWQEGPGDDELTDVGNRHLVVKLVAPAGERMLENLEAQRQHRDATLVAIALELYKRRHGTLPTTLAQLTPDLLPATPPDRIDGRPLRYAVHDGSPVVYSIGPDRDDDGGRDPAYGPMWDYRWLSPAKARAELATESGAGKYEGDLVLWPPPPRAPMVRPDPEPAEGE